jgi:hypothetical protein
MSRWTIILGGVVVGATIVVAVEAVPFPLNWGIPFLG